MPAMLGSAKRTEKMDIHLEPTEPITYRVRNPDGTPAVDAMIVPNAFRLSLGKTDDGSTAYQRYALSNYLPASLAEIIGRRSDENGHVTLTGIAANTFDVVDVSSTRFGTQRIGVREGEKDFWFVKTGEIRGRVKMDSPDLAAGTTVRLSTRHLGNDRGLAEVKLDARGQFHVPAIAPGESLRVYMDGAPNLPVHFYLDRQNIRSVVAGQTLDLVIGTRPTVKVTFPQVVSFGGENMAIALEYESPNLD